MLAWHDENNPAQLLWEQIQVFAQAPRAHGIYAVDFRTLLALRQGEIAQQEQYLSAFWPVLEKEVGHYARIGGDKEELHQEAALALWEAAFQYQPTRHRTTVENFVRNHIHRKVRQTYLKSVAHYAQHQSIGTEEQKLYHIFDQDLNAVDMRTDLQTAFRQLNEKDQTVLATFVQLSVVDGMGIEEASRRLAHLHGGTSAKWKKTIQRLRKKWKSSLYAEP